MAATAGKWQKYSKRYSITWETEPDLKEWIQPVPGIENKAFCRFCKRQVRAHRNDLLKHASTDKHIRNAACYPAAGTATDETYHISHSTIDEYEEGSGSSDHDYSRMLASTYNPSYHHILTPWSLQTLARAWLQEDSPAFDYAGFVVGEGKEAALLLMKQAGVLAGRPFVDAIFTELGCSIKWHVQEGDYVEPVKTVATVTGKVRNLLLGERVALNCITRSSGIATTARRLAKIASVTGWKGTVAGTRKTTPGFRLVEKYALLVGGVSTHRHDLSSMIMLKDNHIWTAGSVTKAVKDARQVGGFSTKIEVECRSLDEAIEAADSGAEVVMLDNFSSQSAQEAASRLKTHFPSLIIELSGGITESNMVDFCLEHIDVISLGVLTQGYSTVDFSFKIHKEGHDPRNPTVEHV